MSSSIEAAESSPSENLLANYSPLPGSYDELLDDRGQIRESWRQFAAGLEAMGSQGLGQRYEQARRLLRENGIVQGVAGFPHGTDRHWELDPLPLLLAKSEWDSLASALAQRVQLLNLILADLYGPQNSDPRGLDPAGTGLRPARLPAALPRRGGAAKYLLALVRRPPRARRRRPLERVRRLHARSAGSRPGPGESHRHVPHPADRFPQPARRTPGRILHHPPRHAAIAFRRSGPTIPASCSSRPDREAQATSRTPTSPATWAIRSSKAAI